jgi:hypothetical protein
MAEVKIDELNVTALQSVPPTLSVDELNVTALTSVDPAVNFDRIYARGIAKLPASIRVDGLHAGAIRRKPLATRFKLGYKEEVIGGLADTLGVALPVANYEIALGSPVSGQSDYVNLRLTALKPSGYRRYSDVTYRRAGADAILPVISLETLKPTEVWPLDTTTQIVARLNALFGTKFTELDFVEEATPAGTDRVLTAKNDSFYFQPGSKVNLGRLDQNARSTEIVGLNWTELDSLQFRTNGSDFTPSAANLATLVGTTLANDTQSAIVVAALTLVLGAGHGVTTAFSSSGGRGIRGLPIQNLTLPAVTNAPVDNSGFYNRALVIDMESATGFGFRYLILHYNV